MRFLIVNADDFGMAESVNQGIITSHRDGILTSTSLMANGAAFEQAVELSKAWPQISVGVHLNLTQGHPIASPDKIPTILNEREDLHLSPARLELKFLAHQVSLAEVRAELRAQIAKVVDAGIKPSHLDGHLHLHALPQIVPVAISLAREFSIPAVRCPVEDLSATLLLLSRTARDRFRLFKRAAVACVVTSLARRLEYRLTAANIAFADALVGLSHTGFLNTQSLNRLLENLPNGTCELLCHPGYASPELNLLGGEITAEREAELLALTSPQIKEAVAALGIQLINFRDLLELAEQKQS